MIGRRLIKKDSPNKGNEYEVVGSYIQSNGATQFILQYKVHLYDCSGHELVRDYLVVEEEEKVLVELPPTLSHPSVTFV